MNTYNIYIVEEYIHRNEIKLESVYVCDIYSSIENFPVNIFNEYEHIVFTCLHPSYMEGCYDLILEKLNKDSIILIYIYFEKVVDLCSYIDKLNFKEVLLTHKNTNSSLNIIFYNLHKYIMEFL